MNRDLLYQNPMEYYKRLAEEYRTRFIKLEQEHIFMLQNQKIDARASKKEIETAFSKQISRLEFLNKKQLTTFEENLADRDAEI
mmetsp:Transcript_29480/g.44750  ORF Transcript_29480/g.44750 Transcript_29480/m.44750 type:complete len:84 (+) Transcript_29480:1655-1906(+)